MSKTKKLKIKELSGSLSDYVDIGADASNVDLLNGTNVEDAIKEINEAGYIDRDVTGLKNYTTTEDLEANYTQKSEFNEKIESVEAKVSSIYRPMGSVETYDALADKEATAEVGDVWNVVDTDKNYAWTAQSEWDDLGGKVDLSNYYTKEETYNKDEVDSQIEGIVSGDLSAYLKKEDADKRYFIQTKVDEKDFKDFNSTDFMNPGIFWVASMTNLYNIPNNAPEGFTIDKPFVLIVFQDGYEDVSIPYFYWTQFLITPEKMYKREVKSVLLGGPSDKEYDPWKQIYPVEVNKKAENEQDAQSKSQLDPGVLYYWVEAE